MRTLTQDRSRVQFTQGDACNLPELGQFGCVLAANLITRIPEPMKFLSKMPDIIVPGGILVIASHYVWDEAASPKVYLIDSSLVLLLEQLISKLLATLELHFFNETWVGHLKGVT